MSYRPLMTTTTDIVFLLSVTVENISRHLKFEQYLQNLNSVKHLVRRVKKNNLTNWFLLQLKKGKLLLKYNTHALYFVYMAKKE